MWRCRLRAQPAATSEVVNRLVIAADFACRLRMRATPPRFWRDHAAVRWGCREVSHCRSMTCMSDAVTLTFDAGTLALTGPDAVLAGLPGSRPDPRTQSYRAEARWYRTIIETLRREKITYRDSARRFEATPWTLQQPREAFPHQ